MKGHGAKLPRKKEAAINALLSSRNIEEAAKTIRVSESTLRRWMHLPEFESDYLRARRDMVMQAYARLQQNSNAAGSLLLRLMIDAKDSTKLPAAKSVLELASKALDAEDIIRRLNRLEEQQKAINDMREADEVLAIAIDEKGQRTDPTQMKGL